MAEISKRIMQYSFERGRWINTDSGRLMTNEEQQAPIHDVPNHEATRHEDFSEDLECWSGDGLVTLFRWEIDPFIKHWALALQAAMAVFTRTPNLHKTNYWSKLPPLCHWRFITSFRGELNFRLSRLLWRGNRCMDVHMNAGRFLLSFWLYNNT